MKLTDTVTFTGYVSAGGEYTIDPPLVCTVHEAQTIDVKELRRRGHTIKRKPILSSGRSTTK